MMRMLIASNDEQLAEDIELQSEQRYDLRICNEGKELAEELTTFRPNLVLLDLELPCCDAIAAVSTAAACGGKTIVVIPAVNNYVADVLKHNGVIFALIKPLVPEFVMQRIQDVLRFMEDDGKARLAQELELQFVRMGFTRNRMGYFYVVDGIRYLMENPEGATAKGMYEFVAQSRGGTSASVERAMRQSITQAYNHRTKWIWAQYMPESEKCPSNFKFVKYMLSAFEKAVK